MPVLAIVYVNENYTTTKGNSKSAKFESYALAMTWATNYMSPSTPKPTFQLPPSIGTLPSGLGVYTYAGIRVVVYATGASSPMPVGTPLYEAYFYPAHKSWVVTWQNGKYVGPMLFTT